MKKITLSKGFFVFALFWSCITAAGDYVYSDLQMKTYDEMQSDVRARIAEAEQIADSDMDEAKRKLKDALQLIFSRPNSDNMVFQLVPAARTPLRNIDAYEKTLQEIAESTIASVKNKKSATRDIATGLIILQNIMGETKPDLKSNKAILDLFAAIRDAKIQVDKKVKNELRMRAMIKAPESPSDIAKKIIGPAK